MGLKDQVEKNRITKQASIEKEKAEKSRAKQQEIKQQELSLAQKRARCWEIQQQLSRGIIPAEWVKIYDEYIAKLGEELSNSKRAYFCKSYEVSKEYYEEWFFPTEQNKCTGDMLNSYLNNRFKGEGFFNSSFKLRKTSIPVSTDSDKKEHELAMAEYQKKLTEYQIKEQTAHLSFDGYNTSQLFQGKPKAPQIKTSGVRYKYEYVLVGEFEKGALKKSGVQPEKKKKFNAKKFFKIVGITLIALPIVATIIGLIYTLMK